MQSFGPYVPIIKTDTDIILDVDGIVSDFTFIEPIKKRLAGEILPDDSIITAPSLVTHFILKKGNSYKEPKSETKYRRSDEYVKEAVIKNLTHNQNPILAIDDYYKSSGGQLLLSLGLSLVSEFNLEEQLKKIGNRVRKGEKDLISEFESVRENLTKARRNNGHYKLNKQHNCPHCRFKSNFSSVLEQHLEAPHKGSSKYYMCNWCEFKAKDSTQIVCHNHFAHQKYRCRIDRPLQTHCCQFCPFETNSKRIYTSHTVKCEATFELDSNLTLGQPDEFPAITSKGVTQNDIKTYESTLKTLRLAAYNPHQIKVSSTNGGRDGTPILLIPRSSPAAQILNQINKQLLTSSTSNAAGVFTNPAVVIGNGSSGMHEDRLAAAAGVNQPVSSDLLRLLAINSSSKILPNHITPILQHPRQQSVFVNGMSVAKNTQNVVMPPPCRDPPPPKKRLNTARDFPLNATHQYNSIMKNLDSNDSADNDNEGIFVICEICDAYIENIDFFKSHMQWVHKVKIHSKVLETLKPPLCCQKCNWRYFTDQGLERHLLGSHGLVTSNMQELADHDRDAGRCTICGVRCASKLVAHIREIHKVTLKPAQLSYKCTVCAATFCLYRHFENHVYRVHNQH